MFRVIKTYFVLLYNSEIIVGYGACKIELNFMIFISIKLIDFVII